MISTSLDDRELSHHNIPNRMFLLQCPSCGNRMRYKENLNNPRKKSNIGSKNKRCVFCGKRFKVHTCIVKEVIEQRMPSFEA